MSRKIALNEDDMRPVCEHNAIVTCGTCQRNWCDVCTPTPSPRCPFEYEHDDIFDDDDDDDDDDDEPSVEYVGIVIPRKLPHVGMVVCDCRFRHLRITSIDEDKDTVILEDGSVCSFKHCCDAVPHEWSHPCPICNVVDGFHNDDIHRNNIDPKYLKEKGWHRNVDAL